MSGDRSDLAVPLDEIDQWGQHVTAIFILKNGQIIAVHDWYTDEERGLYKVYSGGDKFSISTGRTWRRSPHSAISRRWCWMSRHIASIVLTGAEPAEADLILDTLASSDFLELERTGSHYIDVELLEEGEVHE